jgi:hypothetical protein
MNKTERFAYLKQKRAEYKSRIELEKRENDLNHFLVELNCFESELVKIVSSDFYIDNIASPTLYNKPEKPVYLKLRFKTNDEKSNVKNVIKNWILELDAEKILIKNPLLINKNDWLEINTQSLNKNFDILFDKLNILYTIMLEPENGNFINIFEFEYDVTIYKGLLKGNEIEYYNQ